jgi:hypothetical protein
LIYWSSVQPAKPINPHRHRSAAKAAAGVGMEPVYAPNHHKQHRHQDGALF